MLRNGLQAWHIIVLLVIIVLLFGANRLPGMAKSVGESLKIFKREIKDLSEDDKPADKPADPSEPKA
ncbi:Sec-independent protein translocase subunit TatA [Xylanimonas ulmi]|uniref:Sec-independent protein translocase protein TatA n=1 Tax=Xylanimonas ulmi TaxID=228973 RepID=A0A4Q7M2Z5_9MICO|nr:Sec-independent protein translocase subunit TatA [Xylanibacterium ulmi]RZS60858.1 sec-independent protein translocase protein TatA [Xylanibacterium ulmi]